MQKLKDGISFANLVSVLALFVALGGSAYAIQKDSVGSLQVKDESLRSQDLKNNRIKSHDLQDGAAVRSADVVDGTIGSDDLAAGSVTPLQIANGAVRTQALRNKSVTAAKLADGVGGSNIETFSETGPVTASDADSNLAREAARPVPLFTAGPFSVYGKCYEAGSFVSGEIFVETTQDRSIFDSLNVNGQRAGGGVDRWLNTDTDEDDRSVAFRTFASSGRGDFYGAGPNGPNLSLVAPDGTSLWATLGVASRNGVMAGGDGPYASTPQSCLWHGFYIRTS